MHMEERSTIPLGAEATGGYVLLGVVLGTELRSLTAVCNHNLHTMALAPGSSILQKGHPVCI